jgi:hypothetical protein
MHLYTVVISNNIKKNGPETSYGDIKWIDLEELRILTLYSV